jgi:hypothetical protein
MVASYFIEMLPQPVSHEDSCSRAVIGDDDAGRWIIQLNPPAAQD